MSDQRPVVVYGASGFSARLIIEFLREYNVPFVAAGRDREKIEDVLSHVPGIEISWTSGQLASWNSGRGFFVVGTPEGPVGGTALGGSAVGGVSGLRSTTITIATISTTTRPTAPAANSARNRWRFRRLVLAIEF